MGAYFHESVLQALVEKTIDAILQETAPTVTPCIAVTHTAIQVQLWKKRGASIFYSGWQIHREDLEQQSTAEALFDFIDIGVRSALAALIEKMEVGAVDVEVPAPTKPYRIENIHRECSICHTLIVDGYCKCL